MAAYRRILVAVDFSPHSERAIRRAVALAQCFDAELRLLHVVETPSYPVLEDVAVTGMPALWDVETVQALTEAARQRLVEMASRAGIPADRCDVVAGTAKVDIVAEAARMQADLIVMGRHGAGLLESLIGSVTDSVMHRAACDVLAVTLDDEEGV